MSTRTKMVWIVFGLTVAIVLGVSLLLRVVPAQPRAAIATAQSFVDCLRARELQRAYQLTTQRGEVGSDLAEFQTIVQQQWPTTAPASVRFEAMRPFQSHGNRLHRWLHGLEVDPPQLWLEFSVGGVPFTVREARGPGGEWRVDYFESHAG